MPEKGAKVFGKSIFRLLFKLFLMISDIVSDKGNSIDGSGCLFECKVGTLT
jgi:hypothetical protein